jgi:hypothetical protein
VRFILAAAASLAIISISLPAHAATLADGTYRCELYSGTMIMHLGVIEISGDSYQGPAFDGNYEGVYPFEVTASNTINWGGPMGGFDTGGNKVVSTVLTRNGSDIAFDVMVQLESGNFSTISCYR